MPGFSGQIQKTTPGLNCSCRSLTRSLRSFSTACQRSVSTGICILHTTEIFTNAPIQDYSAILAKEKIWGMMKCTVSCFHDSTFHMIWCQNHWKLIINDTYIMMYDDVCVELVCCHEQLDLCLNSTGFSTFSAAAQPFSLLGRLRVWAQIQRYQVKCSTQKLFRIFITDTLGMKPYQPSPKVLFEPPSLFRDGRNVLRRRLYLYFQLRFQLPCYNFKHIITQTVPR